jgi:hypothetical protein
VKLGIEAARLGLRVNCVVSRDLNYALTAYEAIAKEVPIRDRRWVVIHVNQASESQIRRMKELGVIATVVPGVLWMAGNRYGLDKLGKQGIPIRRMLDWHTFSVRGAAAISVCLLRDFCRIGNVVDRRTLDPTAIRVARRKKRLVVAPVLPIEHWRLSGLSSAEYLFSVQTRMALCCLPPQARKGAQNGDPLRR